jgi:hypothetical protein
MDRPYAATSVNSVLMFCVENPQDMLVLDGQVAAPCQVLAIYQTP